MGESSPDKIVAHSTKCGPAGHASMGSGLESGHAFELLAAPVSHCVCITLRPTAAVPHFDPYHYMHAAEGRLQSSPLLHAVAVAGRHRVDVDVDVDVVTIATSSGQEGRPKFNLRQHP